MKTQNLKTQLKAVTKLKAKSTVSPIIEGVVIKDGFLYATNLEVYLKLKIEDCMPGEFYIPNDIFKKVVEKFKEFDGVTADGAKIKYEQYPIDEFPKYNPDGGEKFVMNADSNNINDFIDSLKYVSKDELRPALTQVAIEDGHIAATDAHRLRFAKCEHADTILIRPQVIEILNVLGWDSCSINKDSKWGYIRNGESEIAWYICDGVYPNYLAVIPTENPVQIEIERKKLVTTLDQAMLFSNEITHQVQFKFNGCANIHTEDIDFGREFDKDFDGLYKKQGDDIRIGFNGKLLNTILNDIEGDVVTIAMSTPNRAAIFNEKVLLMPVILNENN